jgi:SPP1 family predicted phage head-tail adaptor
MQSGKLDRRITIQERQKTTNPANGEDLYGWVDVLSCAAEFVPNRGQEFFAARQKQDESVGLFRIRHRPDIVAEMRIVFEGKPYDIISVDPMFGRKTGLELLAKTGLTNG